MTKIKALVFDVFGTLVDWRSSIAREAQAILAPLGVDIDWLAFADAWRAQYQPAMDEVRSGRRPFGKLDVLHRRNLDIVLHQLGLDRLDEPTRALEPRMASARCVGRRQAGARAFACAIPPRAVLERQHFADGRPRPP